MNCQGCLKEIEEELCSKCRKELFDGEKIPLRLDFPSLEQDERAILLKNVQRISISGAQVKYSLKREGGKLGLTEIGGEYILKPIPVGGFIKLDQAPANEHLTMQIARQIFDISTAPCAIIYFSDGLPAYLTRRFDVKPDGNRTQQEDFAQLAQLNEDNAGPDYKYEYSYEEAAELIKKYVPTHQAELETFFKQVVANYILQNGDSHLKNFSVFRTEYGDYRLTPAYDIMNTKIHIPTDVDLALKKGLFKDDFETDSYKSNAYYAYDDFFEFGKRIGISEARTKKILSVFTESYGPVLTLIGKSFLKKEILDKYKALFKDKHNAINYSFTKKI